MGACHRSRAFTFVCGHLFSFVDGRLCLWRWLWEAVAVNGGVVSSSMGGCSCLWALNIHGWVMVICGHWMFVHGRSWLLTVEGCLLAVDVHGWAVMVVNSGGSSVGAQLSGDASVGSHGHVGHVHLCVGGRGPWVLIVDGGWWWVMVVLLSLLSLVVLPCGYLLW